MQMLVPAVDRRVEVEAELVEIPLAAPLIEASIDTMQVCNPIPLTVFSTFADPS